MISVPGFEIYRQIWFQSRLLEPEPDADSGISISCFFVPPSPLTMSNYGAILWPSVNDNERKKKKKKPVPKSAFVQSRFFLSLMK